MKKFVCSVCGYVYEGEAAPEKCPICGAPASKFVEQPGHMTWAAEHVVGVAADVPEDIKADLRAKLEEKKKKEAATQNEDKVVEAVVANASMDIPDPMVNGQVENMVQDYARRMQSQGISLDDYMKYTGMTLNDLKEQMKPQAIRRIQTRLVLEAVAKAEDIQISDERLDEELQKMADAYKMEVEKLKEYMGENEKNQMQQDLAVQAAGDFLAEQAKLA